MKRKKPLRSRRQMRPSSRTSKYARRERGTDYMLAVKQLLPCCALLLPGHVCSGEMECHHPRMIGGGMKSHDSLGMPLCHGGHGDLHRLSGAFKGWTKERRRNWEIDRVHWVQRYLGARGIAPPKATDAEMIEIARWFGLRTADQLAAPKITTAPPPDLSAELTIQTETGLVVMTIGPSDSSRAIAGRLAAGLNAAHHLAEDLREVGNIDVRHPDAAPLPVARVVTEGSHR